MLTQSLIDMGPNAVIIVLKSEKCKKCFSILCMVNHYGNI